MNAKTGAEANTNTADSVPQVLAHNPEDNVAVVVVEGLTARAKAMGVITEIDATFAVDVLDDIPIGHKVALVDLKEGDTVIKYGQDVGRMTRDASKGHHVHTQNMKTKRW